MLQAIGRLTARFATAGKLIGQVLAGLVNFFNPSMVVVGGGLSNLGHLLLAEIRSVTINRSTLLATSELSVVVCELGPKAAVVGAGLGASNRYLRQADLSDARLDGGSAV